MKEIKSLPFKLSGVEQTGEFSGYASTFANVDLGGEVVERGAFRKTLKESQAKIPILDHHDPTRQIGWNLEAMEDDRGLFVRGKLNLEVQAAREKHALMKQAGELGAKTGLSIGFRTIKDERDPNDPSIRRLKEIQLLEYSVVTFPMNPRASIISVKAKQELLDQILKSQIGLDSKMSEKAIHYIQSLLTNPEPASGHSDSEEAGAPEAVEHLHEICGALKTLHQIYRTAADQN